MRVFFVRHGQAYSNVERIVNDRQSRIVHLTSIGKNQAEEAALKLKNKKLDKIFSSPFTRTKETAMIINKYHKLKIKIDSRIKEWDTGFDNKPYDDLNKFLQKDRLNAKVKGHESHKDVKKRVGEFISYLKKQNYSSVLIVTHEEIVRILYSYFNEVPIEEMVKRKMPNAKVYEGEL